MSGYTAFITYTFVPITPLSGYTQPIHCNYIKKIDLGVTNPYLQEININFPSISDFKFLSDNISSGTGYTAQKIVFLVQIVDNSGFTSTAEISPISSAWKQYDVTSQTKGYYSGQTYLTKSGITSTVYKVALFDYDSMPSYNLDYLSYPASVETDKLCFGDEVYFLGNVNSDIEALVYTTNLSITLSLNEFNSSTNPTWDGVSSVAISEIGIFDDDKNLVAIGKLNNPITKDSSISRTIVFAIDF